MIYDVNSPLFRSFLSQKGGTSDKRGTIVSYKYLQLSQAGSEPAIFPNYYSIDLPCTSVLDASCLMSKSLYRKTEEQRPKEQKPKANENKPVMNE
nr:Wound-induced basic protein [Ipomoea batatas]